MGASEGRPYRTPRRAGHVLRRWHFQISRQPGLGSVLRWWHFQRAPALVAGCSTSLRWWDAIGDCVDNCNGQGHSAARSVIARVRGVRREAASKGKGLTYSTRMFQKPLPPWL